MKGRRAELARNGSEENGVAVVNYFPWWICAASIRHWLGSVGCTDAACLCEERGALLFAK